MKLTLLDWIIAIFLRCNLFCPCLICWQKNHPKILLNFFASGRNVPWWLAGLSMVATTFSSDTPNLVTDIVRRNGVAGNWGLVGICVNGHRHRLFLCAFMATL